MTTATHHHILSLLLPLPLLAAVALLLALHADTQRPVSRRPEVKGVFVYDDCRTFAEGLDFNVTCDAANTTTLMSMTTALITNTGLGVEYILSMNDEYMSSKLPPNRHLAKNIALTYEVSKVVLKYKLNLEARVPDRYILQKDTGAACTVSSACAGKFLQAPFNASCDTTRPYAGGISFRSPADDFFAELAVIPTDDMYRGFSADARHCAAASCGVCLDGAVARATCDTERFLMVYPMWTVWAVSPWPTIGYSIKATLRDLDTGDAEVVELGVQLDMAPNGTLLLRSQARAISPGGTFVIEVLQHTVLLPFPSVDGFVIAAGAHPNASQTCEKGDPSICLASTRYEANQRCPPGADAQGIYCPIYDAWSEEAVDGQPQVNPRPERCEPAPRYWAFVQQGANGWEHGYECNQNGIRPDWYTKNNGHNAEIPCYRQKGACVPGYDTSLEGGPDARKLPPFYPAQNQQQRAARCVSQSAPGAACGEWDCTEQAPRNTPIELQSNVGNWNTWLAGGYMWAEPPADTNLFIDLNVLVSGTLVRVDRIRGSGYLQSAGTDPCLLVRGRDGGFMVDVCNDATTGSDFAVDISCPGRYGLSVGSTTVSVPGSQCVTVGPVNIRLEGDVVPGGDFCKAQLSELGTFSVIDTLDEHCTESAPRREEPLGAGQSGLQGQSACSGPACAFTAIKITNVQFTWLVWGFGLAIVAILVILIVAVIGSLITTQVAAKAL